MGLLEGILIVCIGFILGLAFFGVYLNKKKLAHVFDQAQEEAKRILDEARRDADRLVKASLQEAKEESRKRRKVFEEEAKKRKGEVNRLEKKIRQREQMADKRMTQLQEREEKALTLEKKLLQDEKRKLRLAAEYELMIEKNKKTLEKVAHMSVEEARRELMASLQEEARKEAQQQIQQIEAETRVTAKQKAREIVSLAVQRLAGEYVNDATVSVVNISSEDMKGRIIGREGRNIRALEQATGVDLIIDDTPEAVILSCFNPIRREIARITLERLIADGRIHPARIEETAKRVESELGSILREHGDQAAFDSGITDLHPELLDLLGRLRFSMSGTQSLLQHSVETAHICAILAAELKVNVKKAKRVGLLHDIGKALGQEHEGHHAEVGADICMKFGESPEVVEAIRLHHSDDLLHASTLAVLLGAANTLSGQRPGARKEALQSYIKRLDDMEQMINDFPGIDHCYVLQAGREVRALVHSNEVLDEEVRSLADDIAMNIRRELTFPGRVQITVLKESKYVEYAT